MISNGCWAAKPWRWNSLRTRWINRSQKADLAAAVESEGRIAMKRIVETLGFLRSNLQERIRGAGKLRGSYLRASDDTLLALVRRFVDARQSYGYRCIMALVKRELARLSSNAGQSQAGLPGHSPLLERYTGRREGRVYEGKVIVMHSNLRWCSQGLVFTCWNGEMVRVSFAIDAH